MKVTWLYLMCIRLPASDITLNVYFHVKDSIQIKYVRGHDATYTVHFVCSNRLLQDKLLISWFVQSTPTQPFSENKVFSSIVPYSVCYNIWTNHTVKALFNFLIHRHLLTLKKTQRDAQAKMSGYIYSIRSHQKHSMHRWK